ncbi:hypothetical protein DAEQUDRAFT_539681 [Daedalea quercina L-15889]|uniref:Condensation domain-containing protein n=1 Tax=Daedalea quercina L-15889 TaxID=1314783 RepID=A0A165M3A2_9APHY|nr:hypothetical protein DAEQUDRAFT_539681 [Daedalea quercina L-15889]
MTVEAVILPGYDLWMTFIKNVHVLPVSLDIQRFHRSLEVVLRQYPHASGRLRSGESHWSLVKLLQSPIPIQVVRLLGSPDAGLNDRRVIQDNIQEYLYSEQGSAGPAADDRALLLLKLTVAKTETAIGVSWHHTLGKLPLLTYTVDLLLTMATTHRGCRNSSAIHAGSV